MTSMAGVATYPGTVVHDAAELARLRRWDRIEQALLAGKLRLYQDNVLVRLTLEHETRPGSVIIVPGNVLKWRSKDQALIGVVVAVGPGHHPDIRTRPQRANNRGEWDTSPIISAQFVPTSVRVGDIAIMESQLCGDVWPLPSGEHRMVREAEILAVVEREEPPETERSR